MTTGKTPAQIAIAEALGRCSFLPASWDKRFAHAMAALAAMPDQPYSPRQIAHLLRLAHKYRRQIQTGVLELALDETEIQAAERIARVEGALPTFAKRRMSRSKALPLFEAADRAEIPF